MLAKGLTTSASSGGRSGELVDRPAKQRAADFERSPLEYGSIPAPTFPAQSALIAKRLKSRSRIGLSGMNNEQEIPRHED